MPDILYLATDFFQKGGIQRYSRAQIDALRDAVGGDQVIVLSVHSPGEMAFEEPFQTDYNGRGTSLLQRVKYALASLRFSLNRKFDVIWVNHISLLPLAVLLAKLTNIPNTVLNIYGLEIWSGLRFYERLCLRYATRIVSDCHFTANYAEETFQISRNRFSVIWDPVDTDKFQPMINTSHILQRYGVEYQPNNIYLMTLGRISVGSRHKGYDRMLDIMKQIERDNVVYLLVGDGDDRARLEQRVVREGLNNRVFFLGSIPERDLVQIYNAADIFILVSDRGKGRGEGVPLTPLEAASCGKPIIVGNEDGSPEAVCDGENGFVVSPHDLNTLKLRIQELVDDPVLRRKMGKKAREHIIDDFSYVVFKERTQKVLRELRVQAR